MDRVLFTRYFCFDVQRKEMKFFVIHHPALTERRKRVEEQLERLGISAEWITDYPACELQGVKEHTKSPLPLGYISCSMKHYKVLQKMVDEDIPDAVIFEDDVIFSEHFDVSKIPTGIPYVKLSKPPPDSHPHPIECSSKMYWELNNGGAEAYYVTKHFAETHLNKNLSLRATMDTEIHNTLTVYYNSSMFPCVPMCHSEGSPTSVTKNDEQDDDIHWTTHIHMIYPGFTFSELIERWTTSRTKSESTNELLLLPKKESPGDPLAPTTRSDAFESQTQ